MSSVRYGDRVMLKAQPGRTGTITSNEADADGEWMVTWDNDGIGFRTPVELIVVGHQPRIDGFNLDGDHRLFVGDQCVALIDTSDADVVTIRAWGGPDSDRLRIKTDRR